MPEKTFWTLLQKSWIASFQGTKFQSPKVCPKFSRALAIFIWPKEMRWVYTLRTPRWIFTFGVLNWQVWMCGSLLILGSSLLAERYGIRLRNESAGAKKHRIVSRGRRPKKWCFGRRKNDIFSRRKNGVFFSDAQADVVDHPKSTVKKYNQEKETW